MHFYSYSFHTVNCGDGGTHASAMRPALQGTEKVIDLLKKELRSLSSKAC